MTDQPRYSDFGTPKQAEMINRIILGDERGGHRKAYVLSNMDVIRDFDKVQDRARDDKPLIGDIQHEIGKTYWSWRTIARKGQGYGENPAYGDRIDDDGEAEPTNDSETEDGAIREMFIILCGLMNQDYLMTIDACCQDADPQQPLIIIQAYQQRGLCMITFAFEDLEKQIYMARKIFEKRCEDAEKEDGQRKNKLTVDTLLERA